MKKVIFLCAFLNVFNFNAQIINCLTNQTTPIPNSGNTKSINDIKIVRVNFHFMQNSAGGGNFTATGDGIGGTYSGYDYARNHISYMNNMCSQNAQLAIPIGNAIPNLPKNYKFVLDGVYFIPNDNTYSYGTSNYNLNGHDKDNVFNIFIAHGTSNTKGNASSISDSPLNKWTETSSYWYAYVNEVNTGSQEWAKATTTLHELTHLLTLSHTVWWNGGSLCPTGCPNSTSVNSLCDDGCTDTPTAWEITQANNCSKHPGCSFNETALYCSNNLMDYSGQFSLSPCQIGKVHSALEGGLKQFLTCYAVNIDQTFCDLGYPKISYFGKDIIVGNCGTLANITNKEKIDMYFSSSVELNNFEVRADSEFEIILEPVCGF